MPIAIRSRATPSRSIALVAIFILVALAISVPAGAVPSACDTFAAEEPLAIPSTEITVDDALRYLEYGHDFSEWTREMIRDELIRGGGYSAYIASGNLLDLVKVLIVTAKVGEALERESYLESLCLVAAQGATLALRTQLSGSLLSSVASTASLAVIPIEIVLNDFLEYMDTAAWSSQIQLYQSARELGYSHADILSRTSNADLLFDDRGWLLMAGDYCVLWGCGAQSLTRIPVSGTSPKEVYALIGAHYDASLVQLQRQAEEERVVDDILAAIQPGIVTSPRWPSWPDEVTFSATGSAVNGLADSAFEWTLGDGSTAVGASIEHHYELPGTYQVELQVTLSNGAVEQIVRGIHVAPPAIEASAPDGWDSRKRRFSTISSSAIAEYRWDFGDGSPVVAGADTNTVEHEFASNDERRVRVELELHSGEVLQANWSGSVGTSTRYLSAQTIYGYRTLISGDYVVTGTITVAPGATLEIEPGTELKFRGANAQLSVEGTLLAEAGGEAERIVFTSSQAEPAGGDWRGIVFAAGSDGALRYVTVEYAGGNASGETAALIIDSAPVLERVVVRHIVNTRGRGDGIWIRDGGAPTIAHARIEDVESWGIYADTSTALSLPNNTIRNNGAASIQPFPSSMPASATGAIRAGPIMHR